jgi:hypothetical protein
VLGGVGDVELHIDCHLRGRELCGALGVSDVNGDDAAGGAALAEGDVSGLYESAGGHAGGCGRRRAGLRDTAVETPFEGADTEKIAFAFFTLVERNLFYFPFFVGGFGFGFLWSSLVFHGSINDFFLG